MNIRKPQFFKIVSALFFFLSVTTLHGLTEAEAAPPQLCITSPTGMPYYNPGRSIRIDYESSDYGTDPDHSYIDWMQFYYRWDGSSTLHYITAETVNLAGGTVYMTAPASAGIHRLTVIARYEYDDGTVASQAESDFVRIVPEGDNSLWISSPNPPPAGSCSDPLVMAGGTMQLIGWNLNGCSGMGDDNELVLSYTLDGVSFTPIRTITDPCDTLAITTWTVPEENTDSARLKASWQRSGGTLYFTSTYPFTITTSVINRPPVADLGPDFTVFSGERASMSGCTTDPDGDPLSYDWSRIDPVRSRYPVDLYASNVCSRRFTAPCVNHEITVSFRVAIDDGHHLPVTDEINITVQPSAEDLDGDCADTLTDNCPLVANPDQADYDHDGVGDVCDNCWQESNSSQHDSDGDRKGDACDVCPDDADDDFDGDGLCADVDNCDERANLDQADWDGDGEGDSCDCNDGYSGPYEQSADCGYGCPEPCSDNACQPLINNGPSHDRIDVVLIPANDYWSTWPAMANPYHFAIIDAMNDFQNSYLADPTIGSVINRRKLNLWYTTATVADTWMSYASGMRWDAEDWKEDCPEADIGFVMHVSRWRDYSTGDVFSTDAGSVRTMLHETGHSLFDLGDEYDDGPECTTHYFETDPDSRSNIWRTDNSCEDNSSLPDADCHRFTDCQRYWYKAHPDGVPTMMNGCDGGSGVFAICDWGPDALRQVENVMADYSGTSLMVARTLSSNDKGTEQNNKALVAKFHYDGNEISLIKTRLVYGGSPERRFNRDGLSFRLFDKGGILLSEFSIRDPRYIDYAEDPLGGGWQPEVDFSEVFPFQTGANKIHVTNIETGKLIAVFDISTAFRSFCGKFPDDTDCICEGNMDDDNDQDGSDNAEFASAFGNKEYIADLNLDQQINSTDIALFSSDYGRDNCPDSGWPSCDDNNLCTRDFYDPAGGKCINKAVRCNDWSMCTEDDCSPQTGCIFTAKNCDDANQCTIDSCDPVDGTCSNTARDCNDDNSCTNDFCDENTGNCISKTLLCNDFNEYTVDQCDPVSGCFSYPMLCDDNNPCTVDSVDPQTGECVSRPACSDEKLCTEDYCDQKTGECSFEPIVCDQDNNLCTIEQCIEDTVECQSIAVDCNDKDPCTEDSCDPQLGCIYKPVNC